MAITKLMNITERKGGRNIHAGLKKAIKYIVNGAKTEDGALVGVSNIILGDADPAKTAYDQMIETKMLIGKLDGRQGYHFIIAFPKNEGVTPQQALEIGREFCEEYLQDFESIYSVHVDKSHVHVHVVFNSVPYAGGRKYRYENGDWKKAIQPFVNELCRRHNLSELKMDKPAERKYGSYGAWKNKEGHSDYSEGFYYSYAHIRADLDRCIKQAQTYEEFLQLMVSTGYHIDDSKKHLRIFAPGRQKAVRSYILTPDHATYTKENIKRMISGSFSLLDRREVLKKMYKDWNVFLRTERIKVARTRRKTLEFAQKEEAIRMLLDHGLQTTKDVETYLQYLEATDRELNVIRKYANSHKEHCAVYAEELKTIIDYVKNKEKYVQDGTFSEERHKAEQAYDRITSGGVSPLALYKSNKLATHILECVDAYKKKLFVDKVVAKRAEAMVAKKEREKEKQEQERKAEDGLKR